MATYFPKSRHEILVSFETDSKYFSITVSICQGRSCGTVIENHLSEHQVERPRKQYPFFLIQFQRNAKKHQATMVCKQAGTAWLCCSAPVVLQRQGNPKNLCPQPTNIYILRMVTFSARCMAVFEVRTG